MIVALVVAGWIWSVLGLVAALDAFEAYEAGEDWNPRWLIAILLGGPFVWFTGLFAGVALIAVLALCWLARRAGGGRIL